jgi:transposase
MPSDGQASSPQVPVLPGDLSLRIEKLGPLPLVNHFLDRAGIPALFERFVPSDNARCSLPYAQGLGVLLRSILMEREPIYRQHETVAGFAAEAFGLSTTDAAGLTDDQIGRALDRLFDADRGTLLTELVVQVGKTFDLSLTELHNDSTTVKFSGQYRSATGRPLRGKKAPLVTFGFSKDHRPDLKQLLFILTTSRDGAVPVHFRREAGNTSDVSTHPQTWDELCRITGRKDFLYIADCKLCSGEALDHIAGKGGRFVTVIPRNRFEDKHFREWIQTHEPDWDLVREKRNPRRRDGPRDQWRVHRAKLPSKEGWSVIWVWSTLLRLRQEQSRQERIARATQDLEKLAGHLAGPRPRRKSKEEIWVRVKDILVRCDVEKYFTVNIERTFDHEYRQTTPGRPGENTLYRRNSKGRWQLTFNLDQNMIAYDRKSDGMYPLLCNDSTLTPAQVLLAHKRQPAIERRFKELKSVFEIAPVFLKNEGRIEALFFLYFVALLMEAIIQRELRRGMARNRVRDLPLYPEERKTRRPTAEQIFRAFSTVERHVLLHGTSEVRAFEPKLTITQAWVLSLLGVDQTAYRQMA